MSRTDSADSMRSSGRPNAQQARGATQDSNGVASQGTNRPKASAASGGTDERPSKQQRRDAANGKPQEMAFRNGRTIDLSNSSPPPPPLPSPPAPRAFINLDSPSPPPPQRPSNKAKASTSTDEAIDEDSRYAVKQGKSRAEKQPEKITFVVHNSDSEMSSDESSDIAPGGEIDSDDEIEQLFNVKGAASRSNGKAGNAKDTAKGKKGGQQQSAPSAAVGAENGPRTRSRTLSAGQQTATRPNLNGSPAKPGSRVSKTLASATASPRKHDPKVSKGKSPQKPKSKRRGSSDMSIGSGNDSSSSGSVVLVSSGPSKPFSNKSSNAAASGGKEPRKALAAKQVRRDFWKAKAPIDRSTIVDDDVYSATPGEVDDGASDSSGI